MKGRDEARLFKLLRKPYVQHGALWFISWLLILTYIMLEFPKLDINISILADSFLFVGLLMLPSYFIYKLAYKRALKGTTPLIISEGLIEGFALWIFTVIALGISFAFAYLYFFFSLEIFFTILQPSYFELSLLIKLLI